MDRDDRGVMCPEGEEEWRGGEDCERTVKHFKTNTQLLLLAEGERIQKSLSDPGSVSLTLLHIFKLFCKIGQTFCILYKIIFNTIL